jgi:hypothetical protein
MKPFVLLECSISKYTFEMLVTLVKSGETFFSITFSIFFFNSRIHDWHLFQFVFFYRGFQNPSFQCTVHRLQIQICGKKSRSCQSFKSFDEALLCGTKRTENDTMRVGASGVAAGATGVAGANGIAGDSCVASVPCCWLLAAVGGGAEVAPNDQSIQMFKNFFLNLIVKFKRQF